VEVVVRLTTPTISLRRPVAPTFVNGRLTEKLCPLVTVKDVAVPIAAPLAFTKEMLPVQDAAAPLADAVALFSTLTCAVSELPNPTGGKLNDRVVVVDVVCPNAPAAVSAASVNVIDRDRLRSLLYLSWFLGRRRRLPTGSPILMRIRTGLHHRQFRAGPVPLRS
jgi:hypothetical protein